MSFRHWAPIRPQTKPNQVGRLCSLPGVVQLGPCLSLQRLTSRAVLWAHLAPVPLTSISCCSNFPTSQAAGPACLYVWREELPYEEERHSWALIDSPGGSNLTLSVLQSLTLHLQSYQIISDIVLFISAVCYLTCNFMSLYACQNFFSLDRAFGFIFFFFRAGVGVRFVSS